MDFNRTFDFKSNPMDSSHFENNFKRKINCPATQANVNELSTQQGCGAGSEAILNGRSQKLLDG